jgi:ABC-type transporter MlaC component
MKQPGVRLASLLLISTALAATPASARFGGGGGFHGGGGFGGGGFHGGGFHGFGGGGFHGFGGGGFHGFGGGGFHGFGGGGFHAFSAPHFAPSFSVPHFAPRISAPHLSVPHFAPHIATPHISTPHMPHMATPHISAPRMTPHMVRPAIHTPNVAAQHFARPLDRSSHPVATGAIANPHALTHVPAASPTGRAFALAGPHGLARTLHNPFIAQRPGLTHATFQGRFAHLPWRHFHRRFFPIAIGWFGPLFWPYAYDDFLDYTFYPYAYDTFWPYAYDDLYDGMFGLYAPEDYTQPGGYVASGPYPAAPAVRVNARPGAPGSRSAGVEPSVICSGQTAGVTDWRIDEIAKVVEPNEAQRAALEELRTAMARSLDILRNACPTSLASTPNGRITAMHERLSAMLEAVRTVREPLAKFYDLLNDEQRARFNSLGSGTDEQNEEQARRDLAQACSERATGIGALPMERIERMVQPDDAQRKTYRDLQTAIAQAGEVLKSNCPTYKPLTPVVRLEAMEQRLDAMLHAVDTVQPALAKFYGSLSDEQKERFNRLSPGRS